MQRNKTFTIFIADEDPFYAALLEQYLTTQDHRVQLFESSKALIADLHHNPGIILLDFFLEFPKNGGKVLCEIKNLYPAIPVVFLTSQESIEVAVSALQYGAFDYIEKNAFTFAKLDRVFEKIKYMPELSFAELPMMTNTTSRPSLRGI